MSDDHMDCQTFEASLSDFLEGGLAKDTYAACERHRAGCAACHALVADLDAIVATAHALPLPQPSRDLWVGIEARLETPVLPLDAARHRGTPVAPVALRWRRLAVAAVALVTVSAGATWTLARREPAAAVVAAGSTTDAATTNLATTDAATTDGATTDARTAAASTSGALAATRVSAADAPTFAIDTLYGREIAMLRTAADSSLTLLDSTTVVVVRRNLDIIDNAIRESREALAADPNSGFLLDQLDRAYERKVDLLRRLVLL